jgi:hypothetical protein
MSNVLELAKSSRSSCRLCKAKIEKDEVRFGEESTFRQGDREFTSLKWYHFDCAVEKFSDKLVEVEDFSVLDGEKLDKFNALQKKLSFTNFGYKQLNELTGEEDSADVEAVVLRFIGAKDTKKADQSIQKAAVAYLQNADERIKLFLWNSLELELKKGDRIYLKNVSITIGNDEYIELHESSQTKISVNEPINRSGSLIKKYQSKEIERPGGNYIGFEYAKSSRASCTICDKKINKGDLKLVKPVWGENEQTGQKFPSLVSYHVFCVLEDKISDEILHESLSRLTPDILNENKDIFKELHKKVSGKPKEILDKII